MSAWGPRYLTTAPPRSPMVDESLLSEIFAAFGTVTATKIQQDPTGVAGYVDYSEYVDAR